MPDGVVQSLLGHLVEEQLNYGRSAIVIKDQRYMGVRFTFRLITQQLQGCTQTPCS